MCGGTYGVNFVGADIQGLSPRVRGNPTRERSAARAHGSIPACAGEPDGAQWAGSPERVYPRVCGGTFVEPVDELLERGLSPRVRGNLSFGCLYEEPVGSIPACAGEPRRLQGAVGVEEVYPRVCGGTRLQPVKRGSSSGLSPRVRGNRLCLRRCIGGCGSIPACAGEPGRRTSINTPWRVYPRVCGGTGCMHDRADGAEGLSPRVRGNLRRVLRSPDQERSIPACAGEPSPPQLFARPDRVYPRVCGGTIPISPAPTTTIGLSPRVRGNPPDIAAAYEVQRSIPACAGEPCWPSSSGPIT